MWKKYDDEFKRNALQKVYDGQSARSVAEELRVSGKGNCYNNAQAESFFSRFKAELNENGVLEDIEQAHSEIFSYIEGYYNRVRLHSGLGYKVQSNLRWNYKQKMEESKDSFLSKIT